MDIYLGIDIGSVSANFVLMDSRENIVHELYLRTHGQPLGSVKAGLQQLSALLPSNAHIVGAGVTGSGRKLIAAFVGADMVKNEITAHAAAAVRAVPEARTVIEIGGQDSKIIILRDGLVFDFAMNSVCAAGTGSFLDQQANRLGVSIEDFGEMAREAASSVRIAGRCTVFAESDMVHKQQTGASKEQIIKGLCEALARNFLSSVAKGKDILAPVVFQGGVAANAGMKDAFEKELGLELIVPRHFLVMGAFGAALLAKEAGATSSKFRGFDRTGEVFVSRGFDCGGCSNLCEITELKADGGAPSYLGGRCGKWEEKHADPDSIISSCTQKPISPCL